VVSLAIEEEIKPEVKIEELDIILKPKQEMYIKGKARSEGTGISLKPKQELVAKSAAHIVHEHNGNMAPAARMTITRRVLPLVILNPYQRKWTIKVRVTGQGKSFQSNQVKSSQSLRS
ncbi:hypothetical protein U1Q18_011776, partial [Sarracenia purpurea var. burkii]